ncbi:MAG: ankyrin repeat domain-containing protein [Bacteroidota bacterium]|nr:ankyrin repeat domain-containing protein [Bacteroidota bacterium]
MHTNIYTDIKEPLFRQAVEAVDAGNISLLKDLLAEHPDLINQSTWFPGGGYFECPCLIYFVAGNPTRNSTLPENILGIMKVLIENVKQHATNKQEQLDYTLGLIESGRIPRECGKQIAMMDLLIDAGAKPGNGSAALAHGNIDAAKHLIKRGGEYTLVAAACFNETDKIKELAANSNKEELLTALTAAAFYGNAEIIALLLKTGVNPGGYPQSGFHTHATPLHQAVHSGSLECVKLLIGSGADSNATDKVYKGTALGWAIYMQAEAKNETEKNSFKEIEEYLKTL